MATCPICIKDFISCGNEGISVMGTLLPDADYTWYLTTPQSAKYSGFITTDADGHFVIDVTALPEGLLNPYAGMFSLSVRNATCSVILWNDSAYCDAYGQIDFEVVNGNLDKNTLGCPCLEDIDGCCSPTIIPFTDVATKDIVYTAAMLSKYGPVPTVQVWIYDAMMRLTVVGVTVVLDANPATLISIDFGGIASGLIIIR